VRHLCTTTVAKFHHHIQRQASLNWGVFTEIQLCLDREKGSSSVMEISSRRTSESDCSQSGLTAEQFQNGVVCFYVESGLTK